MLTQEQIDTAVSIHSARCYRTRAGDTSFMYADAEYDAWRRNGATKYWKRHPERFSIPVIYRASADDVRRGYITSDNHHLFHSAEDCPLKQ